MTDNVYGHQKYAGSYEVDGETQVYGSVKVGESTDRPSQGENYKELIDNWDNDAVVLREGDIPHHILKALGSGLDQVDIDIAEVYDSRFIESASDSHLGKIGEQVAVLRKNNEKDDAFRIRVESGYARAVSDSTFDTFARVVLNIFDADGEETVITGADGEPVVIVRIPLQYIEKSPLTKSEITEELTESTPASDGVRVEGTGTFELGGPNYTPSSNSGLNEGTLGHIFES